MPSSKKTRSSQNMSNVPIHHVDMPDPWAIHHNNLYYLTFTLGDRVEIWSSPDLESYHSSDKSCIWTPTPEWSSGIWAPELHFINSTWYVYFAGERAGQGNASHRTLVLRSSHADPMVAAHWEFLGPLKGVPDHWAIDATILNIRDELYCCYSGWPINDSSDTEQVLFLTKLLSPHEAELGSEVVISKPELPWERVDDGRRGVNEGPSWLSLPSWKGIVYSANGSWTKDYRLGALEFCGGSPLNPNNWRKKPLPLLESDAAHGGPYGPGHASFILCKDGCNVMCVYHGTANETDGWGNRKARVGLLNEKAFNHDSAPVCCGKLAAGKAQKHEGIFHQLKDALEGPKSERTKDEL